MQEENDISNRDSAPAPIITSEAVDNGTIYTITNEKGLILYSSLTVNEKYYFMVNNRGHEINFDFTGEPTGNSTTLDKDNDTISFFVPDYGYDSSETYSELESNITSQAKAEPILSSSRNILFHFFDYRSEPTTFTYSEHDGEISLQSTDQFLSSPKRNIGFDVFSENEVSSLIPEAVNSVLTMEPNENTIDY